MKVLYEKNSRVCKIFKIEVVCFEVDTEFVINDMMKEYILDMLFHIFSQCEDIMCFFSSHLFMQVGDITNGVTDGGGGGSMRYLYKNSMLFEYSYKFLNICIKISAFLIQNFGNLRGFLAPVPPSPLHPWLRH